MGIYDWERHGWHLSYHHEQQQQGDIDIGNSDCPVFYIRWLLTILYAFCFTLAGASLGVGASRPVRVWLITLHYFERSIDFILCDCA